MSPHHADTHQDQIKLRGIVPTDWNVEDDDRARTVLLDRCLRRFGITPRDSLAGPIEQHVGPRTLVQMRYGTRDVQWAATYGYWFPGQDAAPPAIGPPSPQEGQVATGAVKTYRGSKVPDGGCVGEVARTLDGPGATASTYADALAPGNDLNTASFRTTRQEPAVRAAEQAWSACMNKDGYRLPPDIFSGSAQSLGDSQGGRNARPKPSPGSSEVRIAVADAKCVGESRVDVIWNSAEIAYQRARMAADPAMWARIRKVLDIHYTNVQFVLEGRK